MESYFFGYQRCNTDALGERWRLHLRTDYIEVVYKKTHF